jgi:hypothetical protein
MGELDRALTRAPGSMPRRRAWGTLLAKWRDFVAGGGIAGDVANRYVTVAGAFAADLGALAPTPPVVVVAPAPPAERHWLRWTLIAGGLGAAGWFGWRWYASRRRGSTGPGEALPEPADQAGGPEQLRERIRVLTANPAHNPPVWVRDETIWARAKGAVTPYWESYHDPYAVVTEVYRKMGGRIADEVAS